MANDKVGFSGGDERAEGTEQAHRELTDAAKRALAEADARRKANDAAQRERVKEVGGRGGLDPVRYGDWEKDGIVSDF
jgi:hypothetical protein